MCYYFNDIITIDGFDFDNILIDKKSYENTLVSNISQKILIDFKLLHIRFDKIDGFMVYNGTRCLVIFGSEKYDSIYDRIRDLISVKSGN